MGTFVLSAASASRGVLALESQLRLDFVIRCCSVLMSVRPSLPRTHEGLSRWWSSTSVLDLSRQTRSHPFSSSHSVYREHTEAGLCTVTYPGHSTGWRQRAQNSAGTQQALEKCQPLSVLVSCVREAEHDTGCVISLTLDIIITETSPDFPLGSDYCTASPGRALVPTGLLFPAISASVSLSLWGTLLMFVGSSCPC